ncbi:TetR/AcrR family transcriptional regulator [Williamsia sp.]|uniref:TetR/AcrR family transcriptional regulator n=1 Tax=Williamsia sp. TaxID=1872085 RepID=UPI002F952CDD
MTDSTLDRGKRELLDAAERMMATRGYEVPLRDIAVAAGHRNNSAVQYHYGNRRGLIAAIVARRLGPMEVERERMLEEFDAQGKKPTVRDLISILVLPILEMKGTHYARFLEVTRPSWPDESIPTGYTSWPKVLEQLNNSLAGDTPTRHRRVAAVATAMFALIADFERRTELGEQSESEPDEIIDMLTSMMTTPIQTPAK